MQTFIQFIQLYYIVYYYKKVALNKKKGDWNKDIFINAEYRFFFTFLTKIK